MKKRKIIIVGITTLLLSMIAIVIYAAYTYNKDVEIDSTVGVIEADSKYFFNYSAENNLPVTNANYRRQSKLRKDTVLVIDGILLNSSSSYSVTSDITIQAGKTYYTKNGNEYEVAEPTVGSSASGYYEEVKTYDTINSISTAYDNELNDLSPDTTKFSSNIIYLTLDNNTYENKTISITCTVSTTKGIITKATIANETDLRVSIDADGLGFVVLDNTITTDSSKGYTEINANEAITCSASEGKINNNNIYLSQLGLNFTFTSEVAAYVRIHIQDAWKRTRVYSSTTKINYILKDQIDGVSPFTVQNDDWYFDAKTNYVYLKEKFMPIQNSDGTYQSTSYTFDVNEAYYYNAISTSAYTEYIEVQVSFTVDIVQANRAYEKWGIDPSTIGNN